MDKQRMLEAANVLEAAGIKPDNFDIGSVYATAFGMAPSYDGFVPSEFNHNCGSTACVIGWLGMLPQYKHLRVTRGARLSGGGSFRDFVYVPNGDEEMACECDDYEGAAICLFNISQFEAMRLFGAEERFYGMRLKEVTVQDVVQALRLCVAHGRIPMELREFDEWLAYVAQQA